MCHPIPNVWDMSAQPRLNVGWCLFCYMWNKCEVLSSRKRELSQEMGFCVMILCLWKSRYMAYSRCYHWWSPGRYNKSTFVFHHVSHHLIIYTYKQGFSVNVDLVVIRQVGYSVQAPHCRFPTQCVSHYLQAEVISDVHTKGRSPRCSALSHVTNLYLTTAGLLITTNSVWCKIELGQLHH